MHRSCTVTSHTTRPHTAKLVRACTLSDTLTVTVRTAAAMLLLFVAALGERPKGSEPSIDPRRRGIFCLKPRGMRGQFYYKNSKIFGFLGLESYKF